MSAKSRRRIVLTVLVLVILAALLLLARCPRQPTPAPRGAAAPAATPAPGPHEAPPDRAEVAKATETLTPATLTAPARVAAGAAFDVAWSGPGNAGDFVTVVKRGARDDAVGNYRETKEGGTLALTAPMEPGEYEVRYVTGASRTVLGRTPVGVDPVAATLDAAAEVVLGATFPVAWTGPNNESDFITIVAQGAPDEHTGSYAVTTGGSPITLTAPPDTGEAEIRYVSGQGRRVLARRPIRVIAAEVSLAAPADAVAGSTIEVAWTGPNNAGDYITIVEAGTPDGRYANYANTSAGSPLKLLTPIMDGDAELRYMTGQGHRVLARRPIRINAAEVSLAAPAECAAGAAVSVTWTGPNNPGDYITIVSRATPDGRYGPYTNTAAGSPLTVTAPNEAGEAEVRYMAGQGNKVLGRRAIRIVP